MTGQRTYNFPHPSVLVKGDKHPGYRRYRKAPADHAYDAHRRALPEGGEGAAVRLGCTACATGRSSTMSVVISSWGRSSGCCTRSPGRRAARGRARGLNELRRQLGYQNSLPHFRHALRAIVEADTIPDFRFVLISATPLAKGMRTPGYSWVRIGLLLPRSSMTGNLCPAWVPTGARLTLPVAPGDPSKHEAGVICIWRENANRSIIIVM